MNVSLTENKLQIATANDVNTNGSFGYAVDVEGNYAVVTKKGHQPNYNSAYVFKKTGNVWAMHQDISGQPIGYDGYGLDAKVVNELIMVSTRTYYTIDPRPSNEKGGIHVFKLNSGTGYFEPFNPAGLYPTDVAKYGYDNGGNYDGNWGPYNFPAGPEARANVIIPGPNYDGTNPEDFYFNAIPENPNSEFSYFFDAYYENNVYTLAVGHPGTSNSYIFRHDTTYASKGWLRWRYNPSGVGSQKTGYDDIAIYGDYVFIGYTSENSNMGKVVIYKYDDTQSNFSDKWQRQPDLVPVTRTNEERFGTSLRAFEDYLIVGTENDRVLIYKKDANGDFLNTSEKILTPKTSQVNSRFGIEVSIGKVSGILTEYYAIVGSTQKTVNGQTNEGAFYFYKLVDNEWIQRDDETDGEFKHASGDNASSVFSNSLSIKGNQIIVGAVGHNGNTTADNSATTYTGAAYIFTINDTTPSSLNVGLSDLSNNFLIYNTLVSSSNVDDFLEESINIKTFTQEESNTFFTDLNDNLNTKSIMIYIGFKIIKITPSLSELVTNSIYLVLNTENQTLTLENVLTIAEKVIFNDSKIVDISGGNTTSTVIDKEIFKGLKELSFRKLRQDLKGESLETKIKDISANDNDINISSYLSNINKNLSLNLTGMDLSGLDLTNTDLSGATLVNTDFSGTTLTGANLHGADLSGANLSNVNFNLADFTNLQNFTKTTGVSKNLPSTHQYYLNQPVLSTQNLSNGSYVASTDTIGPFKDGESIAINGVQITFGNSISEAGLLGINNNADGGAFTFIKDDNRLEGWGNPYKGGDLPSDISNVKAIFSTNNAKSAICNDGKVFSWGVSGEGGNAPSDLSGVIDIQSNEKAFVGLYHDGDIVCWGDSSTGGTKPSDVSNVIQLYSNKNAFAALQSDGSIKSWGLITGTAPTTKNFIDIYSTNSAFAALDSSGNVSCWGSSDSRENTPPTDLSNVSLIYGNDDAFAALIADGTVMCWGNTTNGGTTPTGLNNVDYISNTNTAFTAVKNDGTTICWGNSSNGGTKTTSIMGYESTIAVTADASGNFKFSGYDDSSGNVSFINNETQKDAAFIIDNDYYFNNITSSSDNIVYISNKEYNNTTTQTFTFKTLKNIASMNRSNANSYIKIGFIYTGGGTDYSSYRYNNIFSQANCPSYFLDNPAWMKTESKTLTLKLLSDKMTLEGHDGATVYQNTTVFGSPSTYKLAIAIQNGMILLQNPFTTSYPSLYHDLDYKFDQSDSSNTGNTLKFSSMGVSGELLEYTTTEVGTPGSSGAFTILKNADKNIKQLYPYSKEKGLDAGRKHKILNFSIKTIVVTVVASKFVFDGDTSSSPTINHNTLYKFDVSHSSNLNHPLSFSNDNTTTDYNANRFGTAGSAGAFVTFENNDDKNYNMYIHCKTHGTGMGSHYSPIVISRIKSKDISDINKVFSTKTAFAGLKNDGSIVTWGNNDEGGTFPNNNTFENLSNKIDYDIHDYIKMSRWAGGWPPAHHVCIITKSGGFWTSDNNSYNPAHSTRGLKTEKISDIMSGIKKMVTNPGAVAVLKEDGSVITWGEASAYPQNNDSGKANYGGNSMKFLNELKSNVIDIVKTSKAFCALKNDGTIFTWGDSGFGGNYSIKYSEITNIKKIIGSYSAFAAISNTGKLYVWGKYGYIGHGGWGESFEGLSDTSKVDDIKLESGVVDMYFNLYAGFALKDDGLGTSTYKLDSYWKSDNVYGDPNYSSTGLRNHSGNLDISILDSGIKKVFAICNSFFFLKTDNKLYGYGGLMNTSVINTEKLSSLVNISTVCFTSYAGGGSAAVAALKSDGSVITWGTTSNGGDKTDNTYGARDKSGAQIDTLLDSGVVKLYSNAKSFCALKSNGDIVCWGDSAWGGNPTLGRGTGIIDSDFQNFVKITSLYDENRRHSDYYYGRGFAGLKKDGSIIVWGLGAAHAGYSTEDLKNSRDFVDVICGNYQNNVFVGVKKDGSIRIFGESASGSAVQNSVLWSTSQSWNASYKEGHVHLPGTVKTPLTQSTYLTTKKETITIKNEVYKTISATDKAFAGITESGDVTVWGDNDYGGIQTDLSDETNFTHLFSNRGSFAGLKDDQTMFNWGNKNFGSLGGPSTDITISPNLQEINQYTESYRKSNIFSEFGINADTKKIVDNSYTSNAEGNALINIDGTVDTWGNNAFGGLTTNLSNNLKNVKEIITGGGVMTALKADGTTTTWKNNAVYETNKPVGLNNIKKLVSGSDGMVVALKADGTVAAWHNASNTWDLCGNVASNDLTNLSGIVDIYASNKCFAALKYDNSLYVWGSKENSENRIVHNITTEASKLTSGVKEVYVNGKVLIALKYDGTVVTIGNVNNGGDISNNDVQYKLYGGTATDIAEVFLNDKFAIGLKKDNSCVYWGDIARNATLYNNDITTFTNIKTIVYSKDVMVGIKFDGSIVGIGEKIKGAETPIIEAALKVYATTNNGFSLLKTNSEVITWGDATYGGEIA